MKRRSPVLYVIGRFWLLVSVVAVAFVPMQLAGAIDAIALGQLNFYPNIETAGVVVGGTDLPASAQMMYRRAGEANWRIGHTLVRIDDGRLVGSLFGLSPSTLYEVKVTDGGSEVTGSFITQVDELQFTPLIILRVDDDAQPGGDGSALAPFKTIQEAVNRAVPGTQILVADGVYREAVTFSASGTAGNWIQVKAEGSGAVLDGSMPLPSEVWERHESKAHVWFTRPGWGIKYLARDQQRFYQYDTLNDLYQANGHNDVPMKEGWFYDPASGRLYVRIQQDPIDYSWQLPQYNGAFSVDGRDWIWIEGFEMRFYGTGFGCGACLNNASHVVVRRNKIHNLQNGVFVSWTGGEDRGNDTRIEYNEFYDPPLNEWPWEAVKGTAMEATAIVLRGHIGTIVRGNHIHNYFNGIYTSSSAALDNPGVAFDVDVYNNNIHHIADDALEPEGTCVNHRFRNNTIDSILVGISLAPVTMGPVWVMRSTFTNFTGRSIKFDRGSDGWVFIYHNTSWTNKTNRSLMEMISAVHNTVIKNNIFQGNGYSIEEQQTGSTNHDWNYNNWNTTRGTYHFKWENKNYATLAQLCASTRLDCNGHEEAPQIANPVGGNLTLLPTSPNIDRGIAIPGINDNFSGSAPDIGAFESTFGVPTAVPTNPPIPTITPTQATIPSVISILRLDLNPTSAGVVRFSINFSREVSGVDAGDFTFFTTGNVANAAIVEINGAGNAYTIVVNTGTGDGTLRIDLLDNDSILDSDLNPLGGQGAANGNFTSGEMYDINRSAPFLISSLRADPSPTAADTVRFLVTFSESVSGVDAADFALPATGLMDASVVSVNGADTVYLVTVHTGSGSGFLRLDLFDNDSILDAGGLPLGGVGVGNGNFVSGDIYALERFTPAILSMVFTSNGGDDGWILESKENSNQGSTKNSTAATIRLGDNGQNNQYRIILSFPTASLPDDAIITQVLLTFQLESKIGTNPFTTHGSIWVDVRNGSFGSFGPFAIGALQAADFQAPASLYSAGMISNNPVGDWYWTALDAKAYSSINLAGTTQFRLGFQIDDDNDKREDYLSFFSGNYNVTSARPQLTVKYYVNGK